MTDDGKATATPEASYSLDLTTLTLGELADLETESGLSISAILGRGAAHRRMMAVWIASRRSGTPRSWREIRDLRLSDA